VDASWGRAAVEQPGVAFGAVTGGPLLAVFALLDDAPDHDRPPLRAEGSISVKLHPVSSLLLGGSTTPAFKEARMNNVVRNYT
jgi:hypothetical protein